MRPIVVEGPDGAGKSTLLDQLAKDLDREARHTGGSNKTVAELDEKCREQAFWMRNGIILDRCTFISDPIYKDALGQRPLRSTVILAARLWTLDPIIVYCRRASIDDMLNGILDVKKDHKPAEYLAQVRESYPRIVRGYDYVTEYLRDQGFTVLPYDWQVDSYHHLLEQIKCAA